MKTSLSILFFSIRWLVNAAPQEPRQLHHFFKAWGGSSPPLCFANSRRGFRKPVRSKSSPNINASGEEVKSIDQNPHPSENSDKKSTGDDKRIYSFPALYDLAFGYRNYEEEVDFLVRQHQKLNDGKQPTQTLELAAGPARHTITALLNDQISSGTALDISREMKEYAAEIAAEELDIDSFESFSYIESDMRNFELSNGPFDSAWILLGSLQHLTKNEDVVACFQSIHNVLSPKGTLIVELPHPRETFSLVECTRNGWEVPLEDEDGHQCGELKVVWGDDNDEFDPIRQVRQFTVAMDLKETEKDGSSLQSVTEIVPMRLFTAQEIEALGTLSGFRVESMHGALFDGVDVNDELEAFRLVCVLQKI